MTTNTSATPSGSTIRSWPPWVKRDDDLGVLRRLVLRRRPQQRTPTAPTSTTSSVAGVEREDEERAAAVDALDLGALEPGLERLPRAVAVHRLGHRHVDRLDAPPDRLALETPAQGLDLGQLRHRRSPARPRERSRRRHRRGDLFGLLLGPAFADAPGAPPTSTVTWKRRAWSGPSATVSYVGCSSKWRADELLQAALVVLAARPAGVGLGHAGAEQAQDELVRLAACRPPRRRRRARPRARRRGSTASRARPTAPRPCRAAGGRRGSSSSATSASVDGVDDGLADVGQLALAERRGRRGTRGR